MQSICLIPEWYEKLFLQILQKVEINYRKIFGKQKAPVFDLEGNRIPEGSGIMGGKAIKDLMDSGQVIKGARGMKKK